MGKQGASTAASLVSLNCDSKLVYYNGVVESTSNVPDDRGGKRVVLEPLEEDDPAAEELDGSTDELVASTQLTFQASRHNGNQASPVTQPELNRASVAPHKSLNIEMTNSTTPSQEDTEDDADDTFEFFINSPPEAQHDSRYKSPVNLASSTNSRASWSRFESKSNQWRILSLDTGDDDADLTASFDGEQLEALFQRNVRRHEILLGFQAKAQRSTNTRGNPTRSRAELPSRIAWSELQQQLEANLQDEKSAHREGKRHPLEPALVGSSRWMPPLV